MNGVSGRMGYRQHLVRSILAIREQGGVLLADGVTRVQVEPILVGRSEAKLAELAAKHGIEHYTTNLDEALADDRWQIYADFLVTKARAKAIRKAIAAGKAIYTEKPTAESFEEALELARLAEEAGIKNGVVHDKLYLPGLQKLKRLIDSGFFGRILSVRGEFGYWVFEGDWQPAQRPSWNYRAEDGGGIIVDMFPHWNYVLENLFGRVESVLREGGHRDPRARRREGPPLRGHRRRRGLRDLRARGRRDRAAQLELDHPGQPRRARRVPGRRHARLGGRRAVRLQDPAAQRHPEAGVEPRPGRRARLRRRLDRVARRTTSSRTASRRSGRSSSATSSRTPPTTTTSSPAPAACSSPRRASRSSAEGRRIDLPVVTLDGASTDAASAADAAAPASAQAAELTGAR